MSLSKKPYKGCRDFFPPQMRVRNYLFDKMKMAADSFGFEPYDGPLLEEVDLYLAKSGEELINEQIYDFTDRGKRHVAIRPEMTPTLARMVAQVHREVPKPIRWYSIPNLMRYERPQRGRLREHWQFNCDIFGAPENVGEIEVLEVVSTLLESFGAGTEHFEILLNDRRFVEALFSDKMQLDPQVTYKLYKLIDRSKKVSHEELCKDLNELSIGKDNESLFLDYLNLQNFEEIKNFCAKNKLNFSMLAPFFEFIHLCGPLPLSKYIKYDPSIVRGLDYYTGIVFEVFDKNPQNRRAICGGGAYANLLKIFNEEAVSGVGFGLGDVTLTDFLETHQLLPQKIKESQVDIFITFQKNDYLAFALKSASLLRTLNKNVCMHPQEVKFKKAFSLAEKKNANYIVLIDEQEYNQNKVVIKNMADKSQIICSLEKSQELLNFLN